MRPSKTPLPDALWLYGGLALLVTGCLYLLRVPLSRAATAWIAQGGLEAVDTVQALADVGLMLLAGLLAIAGLGSLLRRSSPAAGPTAGVPLIAAALRGVAGAVGVLLAYGLSELLKTWVMEYRPCQELTPTPSWCPPAGDWSWPSNHATLAAALLAAAWLCMPRLWVLLPGGAVALMVLMSRVATGEHYVHDVVCGALLGLAVVLLVSRANARWVQPRVSAAVAARVSSRRAHTSGRLVPPRRPVR